MSYGPELENYRPGEIILPRNVAEPIMHYELYRPYSKIAIPIFCKKVWKFKKTFVNLQMKHFYTVKRTQISMIKNLFLLAWLVVATSACAQQVTNLPQPNMKRNTLSVMETYKQRHSERTYSTKMLSEQDLSDLLWATQGKNREDGHLTAATAMNRQEIRTYVFTEKGVCFYDPQQHTLTKVADGDHRDIVAGRQAFAKEAPVSLVLVADMDKFGSNNQHAQWMVGVDVGIASENIYLFCSAAELNTVARGTMDQKAIQQLLGLTENQIPVINHPVGYRK